MARQQNLDIPNVVADMYDRLKHCTKKNKTDFLIEWILESYKNTFPDHCTVIQDIEICFVKKSNLDNMLKEISKLEKKGLIVDDILIKSLTEKYQGYPLDWIR
ncbi:MULTISPECIES: hypothetical protein [Bacillota]|uniref:hypothetical protein n=1 Tax=Bacillota TaxID=1239 RepID=UPI0039F04281